jgi:hypothetical protein
VRLLVKRSHAKPGGSRRCCPDQPGVCVEWRAQNAYLAAAPAAAPAAALAAGAAAAAPAPGAPAAAPGGARALAPAVAPGVVTDFCSFPGQICTTNGTLLRLDMRGFNLQCPFPVPEMSTFTALTTVNLGRNPNMTARPPRARWQARPLDAVSALRVSVRCRDVCDFVSKCCTYASDQ